MIEGEFGSEVPVLFPHSETHSKVALKFEQKPVSAGFFSIIDGKFECFGKSTSLGIESRPELDSMLTNSHFRLTR